MTTWRQVIPILEGRSEARANARTSEADRLAKVDALYYAVCRAKASTFRLRIFDRCPMARHAGGRRGGATEGLDSADCDPINAAHLTSLLFVPLESYRSAAGAVAQMGERCNRTAEVRGSIPLSSTKSSLSCPDASAAVARAPTSHWRWSGRADVADGGMSWRRRNHAAEERGPSARAVVTGPPPS